MTPIYLIVGPPAVGKSTTSRALAAHFPKSLYIPVDDLRTMVVSGLVLPAAVWTDELAQQITLARQTAVHTALTYSRAGFAVVIDDFWDANHAVDYAGLLDPTLSPLGKVVLYPSQVEAHQRNLKRSGDTPARGYIDEGIRIVYQQLKPVISQLEYEGWQIIDTTALSIDAVVSAILSLIPPP
ncbi:MAG: AAA family ATPase [Chloroflexi bacterium]|uniref:AAA family ATPase n=1 Tax=Candidatus Flexifilum breve TaxID=3140694 RepID=UPI003135D138|nr:AAA family ATPase [Chloroflexota bacterium]